MKDINSKQRAKLRSMANSVNPTIFIGKGGFTDSIIDQVEIELEARELIKGKIQQNCSLSAKDVCHELAGKTKAYPVQVIGKKFVLYRESKESKRIEL